VGLDGVLAQGVFQVDLGPLGRQEIGRRATHGPEPLSRRRGPAAVGARGHRQTAFRHDRARDRAGERARGYVLKSLCEIGARHVLVCGPSAPAVFSGVATSSVVLPLTPMAYPSGRAN